MNRRWVVTIGVALGIVAAMTWRLTRKSETVKPVKFSTPGIPAKPLPPMSPAEVKTVKENAWSKAIKRLEAADRAAIAQIDKSLEIIQQFFEERKKNSPAFAQELLGLRGKWELVKSYLPGQDEGNYHRYLHGKFEACFFKGSDIKDVLAAAVATHLSALDGIENQLLVDLRADIEDLHPGATIAIPDAQSAIAFAAGYRAAKADVTPLLTQALKISAAQEVVSFIAGDIASRLALRVVSAIAARLGISAGILSSGAAAGVATFGLSILAGILVDEIIDRLMRAAGNNPEVEIAQRVNTTLDGVCAALIAGHPEAVGVYALAQQMARDDPNADIRAEATKTVTALEQSGALGLKRELHELTKFRNAQRRAALERQIFSTSLVHGDRK